MRILLLLTFVSLVLTNEHWFVFDQNQFPGFSTPLFTFISKNQQKNLTFTLSTYERSINIDINLQNSSEQFVKLNIERADLLSNTLNHLIFLVIRDEIKFETYVNCKLIDSYLLYSTNENISFEIKNLAEGIKYFQDEYSQQQKQIFEKFGCKQTEIILTPKDNKTATTIGKPLIRKMQYVIEKVQRRKQRSKRHQSSIGLTSDSLTIVYKPNLNNNETNVRTIINLTQFPFHIRYYSKEHLFSIQFNNENHTQFILYADKSQDNYNQSSNIILFLHITPQIITCYVNCELTDQEFIVDSLYMQNIIRQTMEKSIDNSKDIIQYDRQSTLILFNKSIEQIAGNFFCLKLDKKYEDLLPDKYALRKFANALDMLVNSLDTNYHYEQQLLTTPMTTTQSISVVNIHAINGFGSLIAPSLNTDSNTVSNEIIEYDKTCYIDQDCYSKNNSFLKCQYGHCICPTRYFWSPILRHCISCKDISIGNRCFRLSSHKSTWYEANDYCQDENSLDEQQDYTMKLASNLNRTDIDLLKQSLLQEDDGEQLDYFYWIGLTSQFDTRKLHNQNKRSKRRVPTTVFRWYDNGETAQLNTPDIWCSQKEHINPATINNNELCVSLTSCGLYADDCQRNYRFLCEAV